VEKTKDGEGIKQLLLALIHQVLAVSVKNDSIGLQHIHHLNEMVLRIRQQRGVGQQALD
jgi:hypothetical protein